MYIHFTPLFFFYSNTRPFIQSRIIILTNNEDIFTNILDTVERWPSTFTRRLKLTMRQVYTPQMSSMLQLYEPCATERLYLPWALPDYDAALYMDTDMFFMRPPRHLIDQIYQFDDQAILGFAPVDGYYLQRNTEVR